MSIPLLISVYLACAAAIAAAMNTSASTDLALLQTALQVDEGKVLVAAIGNATIANSKLTTSSPNTNWVTVSLVGASICVIFVACVVFNRRIQAMPVKQEPEGKTETVVETNVVENVDSRACTSDIPKRAMPWGTYLSGLGVLAMASLCTDQYVAQMPAMAEDFGCTQAGMAWTLQLNWILSSFAAMVAGPVSDRVGRKPTLLTCAVLIGLSSLACSCTTSVHWFVAARAIQGLAEGGGVIVQATYIDIYDDMNDRVRIGTPTIIILLIAPIFGPWFAGEMAEHTGSWRWSFVLLGGICLVLAGLMVSSFQETLDLDKRQPTSYFEDLIKVISDRHLMALVFMNGVLTGLPMIGVTSNAFIFEDEYHKQPLFYARFQAMTVISLIISIIFFGFFATFGPFKNTHPLTVMRSFTVIGSIVASVGIAIALLHFLDHIWWYLVCCWAGMFFLLPIQRNLNPIYMEQMKNNSGMAGAIMTALSTFIGTILSRAMTYVISPTTGAAGVLYAQAGYIFAASAIFWLGIGAFPPAWLLESF